MKLTSFIIVWNLFEFCKSSVLDIYYFHKYPNNVTMYFKIVEHKMSKLEHEMFYSIYPAK